MDLVGSPRDALSFGQTQEAYLAVTGPASELNVIQFEPPVYPARAVARGTEGWVDLEFIVDTQGLPRDILVTAAEPPGEFDTAALAAAATYVYQPFERDGRTYERRVTLRMRFALE
jgi:protein TonB